MLQVHVLTTRIPDAPCEANAYSVTLGSRRVIQLSFTRLMLEFSHESLLSERSSGFQWADSAYYFMKAIKLIKY